MKQAGSTMTADTLDLKKFNYVDFFSRYGALVLLVVFGTIITILNPKFISVNNLRNIIQQVAPVGIVALGSMFVILTGGIDLSAGVGLALAGVSAGVVFGQTHNVTIMIFTGIGVAILVGFANGLVITRLNIQPFVVTLAMMSVIQGLVYTVSEGKIVFLKGSVVEFIGKGNIAGIPSPFIFLVLVYIAGYIILNKTRLGVYSLAIGGNEEGTRLAGVNLKRTKLYIYTLSGVFVGIGAIVTICRISMVAPNIGNNVLLDAIASTIIGGTSISGGKGTVQGTFIGVLLIGVMGNALNMLNVPPVFQDAVKGLIIIFALYFDVVVANRKRK